MGGLTILEFASQTNSEFGATAIKYLKTIICCLHVDNLPIGYNNAV